MAKESKPLDISLSIELLDKVPLKRRQAIVELVYLHLVDLIDNPFLPEATRLTIEGAGYNKEYTPEQHNWDND